MQKKVLLLGASGTIGRATAQALSQAGYKVTCLLRRAPDMALQETLNNAQLCIGNATDAGIVDHTIVEHGPFDVVISCLASRNGAPKSAWAVDHGANLQAIRASQSHEISQFILLSAICVQKPRLAFQHAKRAAEQALEASGLAYSIVRPTAFFKSLSGQIERVQRGAPFLLFGDGTLTACKPISDADLARFMVRCIGNPECLNKVLAIGGPGAAMTPKDQGSYLFEKLSLPAKFRRFPIFLMRGIVQVITLLSHVFPRLKDKAEFARIGLYYATESMLVWDETTGAYSADATPSFGEETLFDFYDRVLSGDVSVERGDHSVF